MNGSLTLYFKTSAAFTIFISMRQLKMWTSVLGDNERDDQMNNDCIDNKLNSKSCHIHLNNHTSLESNTSIHDI
jgi:hypothetical protein